MSAVQRSYEAKYYFVMGVRVHRIPIHFAAVLGIGHGKPRATQESRGVLVSNKIKPCLGHPARPLVINIKRPFRVACSRGPSLTRASLSKGRRCPSKVPVDSCGP